MTDKNIRVLFKAKLYAGTSISECSEQIAKDHGTTDLGFHAIWETKADRIIANDVHPSLWEDSLMGVYRFLRPTELTIEATVREASFLCERLFLDHAENLSRWRTDIALQAALAEGRTIDPDYEFALKDAVNGYWNACGRLGVPTYTIAADVDRIVRNSGERLGVAFKDEGGFAVVLRDSACIVQPKPEPGDREVRTMLYHLSDSLKKADVLYGGISKVLRMAEKALEGSRACRRNMLLNHAASAGPFAVQFIDGRACLYQTGTREEYDNNKERAEGWLARKWGNMNAND